MDPSWVRVKHSETFKVQNILPSADFVMIQLLNHRAEKTIPIGFCCGLQGVPLLVISYRWSGMEPL